MNRINVNYLRQMHYKIAPLMIFPLVLTVITGTLFQVAVVTGNTDEFLWLLELHRGKFGRINLEMVYPFLNGFGLLILGITGVLIWLQTRPRN
ncbi:MAG: PepSY domain-containing protein [Crocosphaera sp.]|nr:PepSY domain-containing protein [Crocosphaera sp.]